MGNDSNSLAHTTWNCKYHIVFAPKYRRQLIYGELKADVGKILRELCEWKGSNHRGRAVSESYTHANRNTAEIQCVRGSRFSERQE